MSAPTRLEVPEHMAQAVADAVAVYAQKRRADLQAEMNSVHTDHRRRDVIAGALAELDRLEERPADEQVKKAAQPGPVRRPSLY